MLLLSKKSFEKNRKVGIKTRENRISLTRWKKKKKKIEFCRCRNRCLFDCNQFQPLSQSNREGVSSSLTNAKNHTFLFFLEFHKLLRTSRFQISFHISPFQQYSNQKEETKQNKTNSKHSLQMRLRFRSFRSI